MARVRCLGFMEGFQVLHSRTIFLLPLHIGHNAQHPQIYGDSKTLMQISSSALIFWLPLLSYFFLLWTPALSLLFKCLFCFPLLKPCTDLGSWLQLSVTSQNHLPVYQPNKLPWVLAPISPHSCKDLPAGLTSPRLTVRWVMEVEHLVCGCHLKQLELPRLLSHSHFMKRKATGSVTLQPFNKEVQQNLLKTGDTRGDQGCQ